MKKLSSDEQLEQDVRSIFSNYLKIDISKITPESSLRDDLSIDSIGVLEVAFQIETRFKIELSDSFVMEIVTVDDVAKLVKRLRASAANE